MEQILRAGSPVKPYHGNASSRRRFSMRIASLAFFFILIAHASAAEPQGKAPANRTTVCLHQDMIWGWTVVDDKTLIVTDKVQKVFKVSLRAGCLDLKWHQ